MLRDSVLSLYCNKPPKKIRGVNVYVTRLLASVVVNRPPGKSIRLMEMLGSTDSCGVSSIRPRRYPTAVR